MSEIVKMTTDEALKFLSRKVADLENKLDAQFAVIAFLKFHLQSTGVINENEFENYVKAVIAERAGAIASPERLSSWAVPRRTIRSQR
jgi:hypothetical protein